MFVFNPLNLNYFKQVPEVQNALTPYSLKFAQCILPILYLEGGLRSNGGLNNVASDRGGLTKYGISQRAYPNLDIKNLTLSKALSLYHRDYWRAMHCEQSPAGVDFMLLDGAVQHGAPAMIPVRSEDKSYDGNSGWSSSAMNIVGTPCSTVTFSSWTADSVAPASKDGDGITTVAPCVMAPRLLITMPKQW